jgi:hypothetical protein
MIRTPGGSNSSLLLKDENDSVIPVNDFSISFSNTIRELFLLSSEMT